MKEKLEQILVELKSIGVSVSKVETDLGFSNGLLGKVKNGKSNLSDEKFELVESYYKKLRSGVVVLPSFGGGSPEVLINDELELQKFASQVSINSALKQIEKEENEINTESIQKTEPPKVVLPKAKGIMLGADYLADTPKTTFQKLLIEFNSLIDEQPPIKQVEGKLYELIEKSQHHDLNARQSEAIRARGINYLTGQYGKKKPTH
ncbi:MAG: hypothetical protein QG594_2598 [Bacteroidota bacterium]|nr:hypothetical protein [Bacteroidota bacterium]